MKDHNSHALSAEKNFSPRTVFMSENLFSQKRKIKTARLPDTNPGTHHAKF